MRKLSKSCSKKTESDKKGAKIKNKIPSIYKITTIKKQEEEEEI